MYMGAHPHGRLLKNYPRLTSLLVFMLANIALYIWVILHDIEMKASKLRCFIDMPFRYHHPVGSLIIN